MPQSLGSRLKHAWNAFTNKDPTGIRMDTGPSYFRRPDRVRFTRGNERSITTSVYNRIAMDVASLTINHVRLDENKRFKEVIDSGLNECLTLSANLDQTGRAFMQDVVMSLLDEGCIAVVPIETDKNPDLTDSYEIYSMRVGKIIEWKPNVVKVEVYNEVTGKKEEIYRPKKKVAIIENPLYAVVNEENSTMRRLIRKLNLMDIVDEKNSSAKLDLIIQLPYVVKGELRKKQAEQRRQDFEDQIMNSPYGIAYTDGTERITQLNRSVENNLLKQIEFLTNMLYSQLGISQEVMSGTADEKQMLNYNNRTIEPIVSAITDEMKRKFLTKTARTQGQSIMFFRDPFKLVPVENVAEIADKFTRNEIMTSNEFRQVIGMKPSEDPKADELRNSNISAPNDGTAPIEEGVPVDEAADGYTQENSSESSSDGSSIMDMPVSELM